MPRPRKDQSDQPDFSLDFADLELDRSKPIGPQLYEAVRLAIILSKLPSGARLNEPELARYLGVSRTPVREAYLRLAGDGLIQSRPQVGSIVAPRDENRVIEGIILRRALECEVVQILARKQPSLDSLNPLLALQESAVRMGDPVAFFRADEAFHAELARLAGIPTAWRLAHSAKAHTDRARMQLMSGIDNRIGLALEEHRKLLRFIQAGDVEAARETVSRHINSVFDAVGKVG